MNPSREWRGGRPAIRKRLTSLAVVLLALAGCQGPPSTLSPTTLEDPQRAIRAAREAAEVERANREAEARVFRQSRARLSVPEPADDSDVSTRDVTRTTQ